MFRLSAAHYDALYAFKDYRKEAGAVARLVLEHRRSRGRRLLDVGCGTGAHLRYLRRRFRVEGLDADPGMLAVARQRLPGTPLHRADMARFDLDRTFDAVVCLFSAIGYLRTPAKLRSAARCMARHLAPGGVLVLEPWLTPARLRPGRVHALFVDRPDLKIARMSVSRVSRGFTILDFHYLVGGPGGVRDFRERHVMRNFTHREYLAALRGAGLDVTYDREGLTGRGLYIGLRPALVRGPEGTRGRRLP